MDSVYEIEKVKTKTDLFTLKVNGFFLHSRYNPEREAEQFANEYFKENHLHILFGYGLGFIADALSRKMDENSELLIIDPMLEEIKSHIKTDVEVNSELKILEKKIGVALQGSKVKATVICSPNYDKLFPTEYKMTLNIIKDILKVNKLQRNTIDFFANSWQENYLRNLVHIAQNESLLDLKNKFNYPVVVASGGPSLNKQILNLKKIRKQIILIASGSTVNTLLHYEIEPDFVVSIDGGEANYTHFKDTKFLKPYLIYSIRNHYKIQGQFSKQSFAFLPSFEPEVAKHVKQLTGKELPMLLGGTSVAVYALTIALYISSGNIALIGQDLAYTDNKSHAEYNKHFKEIDEDFQMQRGTFFIEGYYGEDVLTDTPFLSMKNGFEQVVEVSKEHDRVYNCTEGGVKINGLKQIPFNQFCNKIQNENINIVINETSSYDRELFNYKVKKEINLHNQLLNQLEKGVKILTSNQSEKAFDVKIVKRLNGVDKELKKLFNKVSMNSIVNPITLDTLNNFLPRQGESPEEEFTRVYNQSNQLYSRLLEATKLSKQYTEELLNDITNTSKGELS